ncbi:carbohydrate binding domain-containing protein [Cohnella soli]|uniref:Carbohydrate binding domain-containing protein n=1 Tax=Cohnella soli TaxID=425005 RepID=A0ABW0HYF3_9BACL
MIFKKSSLLLIACCCLLASIPMLFAGADYAHANTSVSIALKNNTKSFNGTTSGMGGTVMPFGYLPNMQVKDFNDDDLASLVTQFKKTGSTIARLWVNGDWFEPVNDNSDPAVMNDAGFTWNSVGMQSLYKYIEAFQQAGVDCFVDIIYQEPTLMYPWLIASPVEPLSGPGDGKIPEYAEHAAALVKQLTVVKGFTNVKYFSVAGEPNNYFMSPPGVSKITNYKNSMIAIHNRLQSENLLQYVKLVAPEIGSSDYDAGDWLSELSLDVPSSIDAYSIHSGSTKKDATDGTFVSQMTGFLNAIKTNDPNGADKPFMITDYFSTGSIRTPEDGINAVALMANGLRIGITEFGRWSFAEDIWPGPTNQTSTSFGDYGYGIIGSKQENFTVKPTYKATALAHKFIPRGSTAYQATTSNEAVIPAIIKTANGKHTIVVVNWSDNAADVSFTLENAINTTFKKYQFSRSQLDMVDKFGELPASFASQTVNGTSFTDTIPANTVYFYTDIPDGTAPGQVAGTSASTSDFKKSTLTWTANTESDLAYYRIYRSEVSNFTPSRTNKIGERWIKPGGAPQFDDKNVEQGKTYYYKVSAVDTSENEGAYSPQASVTIGNESYTNAMTVDSSGTYYEINADYEGGYKVRLDKASGTIGFLQDQLGYNRLNQEIDRYSVPLVLKYSASAFSNVVQNGGAESGTTGPSNWSTWTGGGGTFTWDTSVTHSGNRSLKIQNSSTSANAVWLQSIPGITAGKEYEVSYWVKTDNVTGPSNGGQGVFLNVQYLDASGANLGADGAFDGASNVGTHGWLNFTSRVHPPAGTASILLGALMYGNSGTAWFDDIRLELQPDIALAGSLSQMYAADSVTYTDLSSTHKKIRTVVGDTALTYDFYNDRIEMKVEGLNSGGYLIEAGDIVARNLTTATWSDGTKNTISDTVPGFTYTKNTTSLTLYQPPSSQSIRYEFGGSKSVLLKNGSRFRGYYSRFQVNSGETFTMKFPKQALNSNGGVETGTTAPTGWSNWNANGHGSFQWDSSVAHWGSKSLKMTNSATDNSAWITVVDNLDLASTYIWSGWMKTSSVSGTQGAYISVEAKDAAYNVLAVYRIPYVTGTNDWKKVELAFNPPAGTVHLLLEGNLYSATGTAWFDDFELSVADTGLSNAGAELGSGTPSGWASWTSAGTPFTWDTGTVYQGKKSLKITNGSNQNSIWYTNRTNLQAGKEYEFGGWIKTSGVTAGGMGAQFEAIAMDSNGNWMNIYITPTLSGTKDWTYVTGKITLPPNAVSLNLEAQLIGVNGTAWFDDMFIRLVDKS